jgi:hypothetical protein
MAAEMKLRQRDQPLTRNWLDGFLKRHPSVKLLKPRGLNEIRAKATTPETLASYFDELNQIMTKYSLHSKPQQVHVLTQLYTNKQKL